MPRLLLSLLLLLPTLTLAQIGINPTLRGVDEAGSNLDSLTQKVSLLPDSLLPAYTRIDSIRNRFNTSADSIQNQYQKAVTDINQQSDKINKKIDSLGQLRLPTRKYDRALKKISKLREKTGSQFASKFDELKAKTTDKLNALDLPDEYKKPIQELTSQINKADINQHLSIPELNIPGYKLPNANGLGDVPSLPGTMNNGVSAPQLPGIQTPGEVGELSQQVSGYRDQLKDAVPGDLTNVENLEGTIESQASRIDGIDEISKQSGVLDEHKADLEQLTDAESAKEKAVEMAKKGAVDHFAGKEEQLKKAMDKISEYKKKYSSVSSIKDLPKRPPNPMKDKPLIERLVPGLYLQYQQKNDYLIDLNPYVGYKLSGRFTSGIGWNHRLAWDGRHKTWNKRSRIFGPRAYVDFTLGKGFIAHAEGESMNAFVPSTIHGNPDSGQREWVWSCMTGIKKEYKIYKNLKGTALIQYNLFNRYYKAPYVDRLNSRIGVEYKVNSKSKI